MPVLTNIGCLATCRDEGFQSDIHLIYNAAIAWDESGISWVGRKNDLPLYIDDGVIHDARGKTVIPGLIDCHTHLAFGGWRADEFEARILGKSYEELARSGGGILSTVRSTREATSIELINKSNRFLKEIIQLGVTAIECKSGYGLDTANELKLLKVYEELKKLQPIDIIPTFLGAHTVPEEFHNLREEYVDLIIKEMLPGITGNKLAEFCDVFVEESAFSVAEARIILDNAKKLGLQLKIHADQLSHSGGAELAAEMQAISADHLEYVSDRGIKAMAKAGVVAVNLPLASLYLDIEPMPARKLIEAGVSLAIATDFNPGSAPSFDLPLAMLLSCTRQGLTPAEALKATTINAAKALDRQTIYGSLEPGKKANFAIIDAPNVNYWMYHFRPNACVATFINGKQEYANEDFG